MNRRQLLAALGSSGASAVAGCLGTGRSYDTVPAEGEPPDGRHQFGFDARNSNYAPTATGPDDEPAIEQAYEGIGPRPLLADGVLYHSTTAVGLDGTERWDVPEPVDTPGSPALHDNSLIGAGSDPDVVYALDLADGSERWRAALSVGPSFGPVTVLGDHAYVATVSGIGAVDLAKRQEAWQAELTADHPTRGQSTPHWRFPAATPEHVFTVDGSGRRETELLYALDRTSGEIDWTAEFEVGPDGTVAHAPQVGDRYVYLVTLVDRPDADVDHSAWTRLVAVDPAAGDVAWTMLFEGNTMFGTALADGTVYIAHGGVDADDPGTLSAIDAATRTTEWTADTDAGQVPLTVTAETVYAGDLNHYRAFDRADGTLDWSLNLPEAVTEQTDHEPAERALWPVVHDGMLVAPIDKDRSIGAR